LASDTSAAAATVVVAVARLLFGFGSAVAAETVAVFLRVPLVAGLTTMSTPAVAPPGKIPRLQVRVIVPEHDPTLDVAETSVAPAGSVSVTVTPLVVDGPDDVPLLVMVKWYVRVCPCRTGSGESLFVIDRSAGP
jgi:hypothetical protein